MTVLPKCVPHVFPKAGPGAGLRRALLWLALWLLPLSAFAQAELRTVALPLPDHYIVGLKPQAARLANEVGWQPAVGDIAYELDAVQGVELLHAYRQALRGFAVRATPAALKRLLADPRVEYVEPDALVWLNGMQSRPAVSWGLDRIDQRSPALDGRYSYYRTGAGVNVYVVDSGINHGHSEFAGRIAQGYDGVGDGRGTADCNGHGSHVSGTIGGATAGVASGVTLHPVRVFGCESSGTVSAVIAGIDWVADRHVKPAVANLSFAGPYNASLNAAVSALIARGVLAVVSVGNGNDYDCGNSTSWVPEALGVRASEEDDTAAAYSNQGTCGDLYAPGSNIVSASHDDATALTTMSGTSMATAHVSGVAALYLSDAPQSTPAELTGLFRDASTATIRSPYHGGLGALAYTQGDDLPKVLDFQRRYKLETILVQRTVVVSADRHEAVEIPLPPGWVAVGGGAEGDLEPNGHLVVASYPNSNRSGWMIATREHLAPAPSRIRGWVIGLSVEGLSRAQLLQHLVFVQATSDAGQRPETVARLPAGYVLLGGGFRTDSRGVGVLATGSWPIPAAGTAAPGWAASAKDHVQVSSGTVEAYAIGIRDTIPGVGRMQSFVQTAISGVAAHPSESLMTDNAYARTGCGARALWTGAGSMLWRIQPIPHPVNTADAGCLVSAKDHILSDPASVQAWTIGLRVY